MKNKSGSIYISWHVLVNFSILKSVVSILQSFSFHVNHLVVWFIHNWTVVEQFLFLHFVGRYDISFVMFHYELYGMLQLALRQLSRMLQFSKNPEKVSKFMNNHVSPITLHAAYLMQIYVKTCIGYMQLVCGFSRYSGVLH